MEPEHARQVVIDCIDEVSSTSEPYESNKRLGQFSIISDQRVRSFARQVCDNVEVGVKAYGFTLAAKHLEDIDSETIVGDIEDTIVQQSVPVEKRREVFRANRERLDAQITLRLEAADKPQQ